LPETSTVIFKVVDSTGAPRPGATVSFTLNTTAGGISLSPTSAVSAADGTVQTVVSSGTEHTAVRVTATIASPALSTQSSALTVTTGIPASGAFSIAVGAPSYGTLACPNVESYGIDLITVPITVQLADRYNNPAPDGTSVAFTTNGGHVDGSCTTPLSTTQSGDGICVATWTSANPRPTTSSTPKVYRNGRAEILATAIGEESFDDVNSSGYYQAGDPFSDLGEPYLDANESGAYVLGDYFLNYYNMSSYQGPSGKFVGITCTASSCTTSTLAIGVEHLLVMSTSNANLYLSLSSPTTFTDPISAGVSLPHSAASPAAPNTGSFGILVTDQNGNAMAAGTTIGVNTNYSATINGATGAVTTGCNGSGGPTSSYYTIPPGNVTVGGDVVVICFTAPTTAGSGSITITVTSPQSHSTTTYGIPVTIT